MKITMARVLPAAGIMALAAILSAGTAFAAPAASTGRLPVVYQGAGGSWESPAVRPHTTLLGADYDVGKLSWSRWTARSAHGEGKLVDCAGAGGPCTTYRAGMTLFDVKTHHRTRYFATMKITGKGHKTRWLVMSRGGSWLQRH
jgi:hypothetical protein